jgi:hypothetical protein
MSDSRRPRRRATHSARTAFNWPLVKQRCVDLGARTNIEAALLMEMSPRTLDGLRFGSRDTGIDAILRAAEILDLTIGEMFPPAADRSDRQAAA